MVPVVRTDGRSLARSVYGHVITKFSGMGRFTQLNRRAFCMRMCQFGLLKCLRGIFRELCTFNTSICRLFCEAEWHILGATFHKRVL